MTITYFQPAAHLISLIKTYYVLEGDFGKMTSDVFYADGCPEIVFNVDVDFYRDDKMEAWAKAIGQIIDPLHVRAKGQGKSFGIWFYPHGLSEVTGIPAYEFTNTAISLDNIFPMAFIEFAGECLKDGNMESLVGGLDIRFTAMLQKQPGDRKSQIAKHAVHRMHEYSDHSLLEQLVDDCNVSARYLQMVFSEKIGIRPKQFHRILKFQRTLSLLNSRYKNLTSVSHEAGYFDQSHFIRDFRFFTGATPSRFLACRHPINKYFL